MHFVLEVNDSFAVLEGLVSYKEFLLILKICELRGFDFITPPRCGTGIKFVKGQSNEK